MEDITNQGNLVDFNWDSSNNAGDFFSEFMDTPKPPVNEVSKEDPKEEFTEGAEEPEDKKTKAGTKPKTEEQEEEEEYEDPFGDFRDPEDELTDPEKPTKKKASEDKSTQARGTYIEKFNMFKEEGLFKHIELEEGEEEDLDEERFSELLEEEYEAEVNTRISQWATEELDEEAKAFIAFKKQGGDTKEFLKSMQSLDVLSGDISDEEFQKEVIISQLEADDWDYEEIKDRLQTLEETGKLESTATKYYNRMKTKAEKQREALVAKQAKAREEREEKKREFKTNLRNTLSSIKEVKGIKITPKERGTLYNFITNEDQTLGDRKVTGFQKSIAEAVRDENKMILLAKLLSSDFDFSEFEKQIKTKEVRKLKENLESRKGLRPTGSSGTQTEGKSLGDIFSQF